MALLLLIRHAVTEATGSRLSGRTPGIHLSERGREQAKALAERIAPVPLAAIHSSPLERCLETAEALAAARTVAVTPAQGLLEVDYGAWTGRSLPQLARTKLWTTVQQSPSSARFPGGETLAEVQRRSVDALGAIAARHPRGIVAAVTHADVIRLALAQYTGVHLDLFQRIVVSPASVSAVFLGDRIPRIVRVNDTGSLRDLVPRRRPPPRVRG
ncbi:MAG TPA: MSMEG_4193 family putative phosphomutase [Actinomycetota bacterium]|nr:MSMEG_4193 family putative phosphomutase [Actinomycetota bacterium]